MGDRPEPAGEAGFLRRLHAFRDLPAAELERLAAVVSTTRAPRGAVIFLQGDPGDGAYFVLEGRVRVSKLAPDGTEYLLSLFEPGEAFGAVVLFDGGNYPATATAVTDTRLACLRRADFLRLAPALPLASRAIARELGTRLRRAHDRLLSFTTRDAEGRLAELLLQLGSGPADGPAGEPGAGPGRAVRVECPPTQQEMGDYIGSSRETVSRILSRWRRSGWVARERGGLAIRDPLALRRCTAPACARAGEPADPPRRGAGPPRLYARPGGTTERPTQSGGAG